jgi:hypothetical protein
MIASGVRQSASTSLVVLVFVKMQKNGQIESRNALVVPAASTIMYTSNTYYRSRVVDCRAVLGTTKPASLITVHAPDDQVIHLMVTVTTRIVFLVQGPTVRATKIIG